MRQLVELLNSIGGSVASRQSSLPTAGSSRGIACQRANSSPMQAAAAAAEPPPLSPELAARHPALRAAEAALEAKLENGAAACDEDYLSLTMLNEQLATQRGFDAAVARLDLNRCAASVWAAAAAVMMMMMMMVAAAAAADGDDGMRLNRCTRRCLSIAANAADSFTLTSSARHAANRLPPCLCAAGTATCCRTMTTVCGWAAPPSRPGGPQAAAPRRPLVAAPQPRHWLGAALAGAALGAAAAAQQQRETWRTM